MTYKYNTKFFAEIDTDIKAYLLGVFYSRSSGRIQTSLSDFFILELIKSSLLYSGPIRTYGDSAELHISSRPFLSQLADAGCVASKQHNSLFPAYLGVLLPGFIRGVFDSYGQLTLVKGKYLNLSLVYNELFIQGLRQFLRDTLHISTKHTYTSLSTNTIKMLITKQCDAHKFLLWVYAERFSCESRNRLKYQEFLEKGV
jgi:hypothetical protein